MNLSQRVRGLRLKVNTAMGYPLGTMALALVLILLSPFVSSYLCYAAFLICIFRVVVYSPKVFVGDFALLLPLVQVFATPDGMSLQVYLYLFAAVWYLIRGSVRADSSVVWFLLLMVYMIARMQLAVANYLLSFGQLFLIYIILPRQDSASAVRAAKLFCYGLLFSSVYALLVRNSWQLRQIIGPESPAIWGTGIMRFRGLIQDPNYYMTMVVVALGLLLKLRDCRHISLLTFWLLAVPTAAFGILTYSKTFLLVAVLLVGFYILWQFGSRKLIWGCVLTGLAVAGLGVLILWEGSPLAVVFARLSSSRSISELTTGRTEVYADYLQIVFRDVPGFLFGQGLAAEGLVKDPHNLYIEILYYLGAVGLLLYGGFFVSILRRLCCRVKNPSFYSRYIVLILVLVLFFSLHGIFQPITMGNFLIAFLAMLITKHTQTVPAGAAEENLC